MHLFAEHEQLLSLTRSWYTSTCWVFALHLGSLRVVHKFLQLFLVIPLAYTHTHILLQSSVV